MMAPEPTDLPLMTASALAGALRSGELTTRAALDAHLERIARHEPSLSAFVTLDQAGARDQAALLDALSPQARGLLHGLPVAVKDLVDTGGLRTTYLSAESRRGQLYRNFTAFFREYDLLITPAASVLPWPNGIPDVLSIDGATLPSIIDYLAVTFIVSLVGFPALTIPAAQGSHPLPFGLQVEARPGEEALLVSFGRALESSGFWHRFAI
jgi:Asp-tRNA(Asn)/Glu-tRNA(Gln) amidotransferase A subunit family amidase